MRENTTPPASHAHRTLDLIRETQEHLIKIGCAVHAIGTEDAAIVAQLDAVIDSLNAAIAANAKAMGSTILTINDQE